MGGPPCLAEPVRRGRYHRLHSVPARCSPSRSRVTDACEEATLKVQSRASERGLHQICSSNGAVGTFPTAFVFGPGIGTYGYFYPRFKRIKDNQCGGNNLPMISDEGEDGGGTAPRARA